jgi:hypothetical protein
MAQTVIHYRIRKDDGSETTATWYAAEDTPAVVPNATTFRVRDKYSEPGIVPSYTHQWEANKNGGAFADVTTGSANIKAVNSGFPVTDGTATTEQLTAGSTYQAGEISTDGVSPSGTLGSNKSVEQELVCQIVGGVNGDVYIIRTKNATYSVQAQVTVGSAGGGVAHQMLTLGVG